MIKKATLNNQHPNWQIGRFILVFSCTQMSDAYITPLSTIINKKALER